MSALGSSAIRVLVAVASKHGATLEIGERIAQQLNVGGIDATCVRLTEETPVDDYDAFVIGSAVYAGRWMAEARHLVDRCKGDLAAKPVWLFSSGPVAEPADQAADPVDIEGIIVLTTARDHRVFCGLLDSTKLGVFERAVVHALGAPEGDYRSWEDIEAWATEIAGQLLAEAPEKQPQ